MRALCVVILSLSLVIPCVAQSTCEHQVVVNVRNSKGEFVPDLQASSFHAKIGGHELAVTSATVFAGPLRLVLAVDASGSMTGDGPRWKETKNLLQLITGSPPVSVKEGLLVFRTDAVRKLGIGSSRPELLAAVGEVAVQDARTALWDSLLTAGGMFDSPAAGDAVLVITDGGDNYSKSIPADVERSFLAKGIRMFSLGLRTTPLLSGQFTPQSSASEEEYAALELLRKLTTATGGDSGANIVSMRTDLKGNDPDAFASVLNQLINEITHFYLLRIPLAAEKRDKLVAIKLDLIPHPGRKDRGIVLTYPPKLAPCSP